MAVDRYLTDDIWIEILCRVPAQSLGRCMSVCKNWLHIIRSNSFINTHLTYQKASSNPNKYLLFELDSECVLLADSDSSFDSTKICKRFVKPDSFWRIDNNYPTNPVIHGICNGLVCLSANRYFVCDDIILWNPTCEKFKKLPELDISLEDEEEADKVKGGVSFGYYDDDYKVIVIIRIDNTYIVSVYSLSTNSWNIIDTDYYDDYYYLDSILNINEAKFADGVVYMIRYMEMVSFDLSNETIGVIKYPKEFSENRCYLNMEAYGGTIALFGCLYTDSPIKILNLWILKDKSSSYWEKKCVVEWQEIGRITIRPAGFLNNGKYLLSTLAFGGDFTGDDTVTRRSFVCDPDNLPKLTEFIFVIDDLHSPVGWMNPNYVESLLLLHEDSLECINFAPHDYIQLGYLN